MDKGTATLSYRAIAILSTMLVKLKKFDDGDQASALLHACRMNFKIFRRLHFEYIAKSEIEPDDLPLSNFSIVRLSDSFASAKRDR